MQNTYIQPRIKVRTIYPAELLAGSNTIHISDEEEVDDQGAKTGSFDDNDDFTNYTPFER